MTYHDDDDFSVLTDLFSAFDAIGKGPAPQLARDEVDGLIVSTIDSFDQGYETAILDGEEAYPVQRYEREDDALAGHAEWVVRVPGLTEVVCLGYGSTLSDKTVTLVRYGS